MTVLLIIILLVMLMALWRRVGALEERIDKLQPYRQRQPDLGARIGPAAGLLPNAQIPPPVPTTQPAAAGPPIDAPPPVGPPVIMPKQAPQQPATPSASRFEATPALVLALVGGLLLLGAIGFFVATAISSGLINEPMQILLGYVASAAVAGVGVALLRRRGEDVARICAGVGAGGWFLTSVAGSQLYDVLSVPLALALMGAGVAVTVWGALRLDSRLLAAFGLLVGCAAPIIVGAAATIGVSAALLVMMAATAIVAVRRNWPSIAIGMLAITAPQLIPLGDVDKKAWIIIASLALWHVLQMAAAAGFDIVHPKTMLRRSTVSLTLMTTSITAAMLSWAVTDHPAMWMLIFGLAQIAAGGALFAARTSGRASGQLMLAAGTLFVSLAAAEHFNGSAVAISWSFTALGLMLMYTQSRSPWILAAAGAHVGAVAVHLMTFDFFKAIGGVELFSFDGNPEWKLGDALVHPAAFVWPWAALTLCTLGAVAIAWRWLDADDVASRAAPWASAISLFVGIVIALPTISVPELGWTIAVALLAPLALLAFERGERGADLARALATAAWTLLVLAAVKALDGPLSPGGLSDATSHMKAAAITTLVMVIIPALIAAVIMSRDAKLIRHAGAAAVFAALVFWLGTSILVVGQLSGAGDLGTSSSSAQTALSSWWALLGLGMVMFGISRRMNYVHKAGAALLLVAAGKVAIIDTSNLESGMRVLALAVVGILLMIGGWIYQRSTGDEMNLDA